MTSFAPHLAEPSSGQNAAGAFGAASLNPAASRHTERRRESRRPMANIPGTLTLLDGAEANTHHPIVIRDISRNGVAFFMNRTLAIGEFCRLRISGSRHNTQIRLCRVLRSIPTTGGHELAVQSELIEHA